MTSKIDAWNDDTLDRQKEANFIMNYLNGIYAENLQDSNSGSFVLNLNAPWGYGKTYFLENLKLDLEEKKHPVLYFDAWKNDYSKTPLLGFISEIEQALKEYKSQLPKGEKLVGNLLSTAKKLLGVMAGIGASILVKKVTGLGLEALKEQLNADTDCDTEETTDILGGKSEKYIEQIIEKSLEEHQELKKVIEHFKTALEKVTVSLQDNAGFTLPMYILIDELDRCRPTYAIELLENIKHIFNANGVFFIVATNKEQLAHSIKAVYGDSFDSRNYLRRFFNQEYTISITNRSKYIAELFSKYRIDNTKLMTPFDAQLNKTENIERFLFEKIADGYKLGLRDMEQICVQLKSILLTTTTNNTMHYPYLIFILMFRFKNEDKAVIDFNEFQSFDVICTVPVDQNRFNFKSSPIHFTTIINFYEQIAAGNKNNLNEMYNRTTSDYEDKVLRDLSTNNIGLKAIANYFLLAQQAGHVS